MQIRDLTTQNTLKTRVYGLGTPPKTVNSYKGVLKAQNPSKTFLMLVYDLELACMKLETQSHALKGVNMSLRSMNIHEP